MSQPLKLRRVVKIVTTNLHQPLGKEAFEKESKEETRPDNNCCPICLANNRRQERHERGILGERKALPGDD